MVAELLPSLDGHHSAEGATQSGQRGAAAGRSGGDAHRHRCRPRGCRAEPGSETPLGKRTRAGRGVARTYAERTRGRSCPHGWLRCRSVRDMRALLDTSAVSYTHLTLPTKRI